MKELRNHSTTGKYTYTPTSSTRNKDFRKPQIRRFLLFGTFFRMITKIRLENQCEYG